MNIHKNNDADLTAGRGELRYKMTYQELVNIMVEHDAANAYITIERMMDMVEEETGVSQAWSYTAPEWVVRNCIGK